MKIFKPQKREPLPDVDTNDRIRAEKAYVYVGNLKINNNMVYPKGLIILSKMQSDLIISGEQTIYLQEAMGQRSEQQ